MSDPKESGGHTHSDLLIMALQEVPPHYDMVKSKVSGNLMVFDGNRQIGYFDFYENEYVKYEDKFPEFIHNRIPASGT